MRQELAPSLTEDDSSRGSIEELNAEVSLERLYPVAYGRLREIQPLSSGRKAPIAVDRQKCVQAIGMHVELDAELL